MFKRILKAQIEKKLFQGEVIILYGARQVGKTTLVKEIVNEFADKAVYFDCDLIRNREIFEKQDEIEFKKVIGDKKLVVLDEAQRILNIGLNLKIMHNYLKDVQVIATGSSSFDLSNKINEPLTGRAVEFMLPPLSIEEIMQKYDYMIMKTQLNNVLRFGSYPNIFDRNEEEAREKLDFIVSNYLYKDILQFEDLKKSDKIIDILRLLAFQVGSQVSYNEIGNRLKISSITVEKYIDLLEKSFIVFRLHSLNRNLRNEIGKAVKIYFWDLGIRNSLIQNFNDIELRNDIGQLFENFCIAERLKYNENNRKFVNTYFWRTYEQKEIDLIEEEAGVLKAFEFKYNEKRKYKKPMQFFETYKNSSLEIICKENYLEFLLSRHNEVVDKFTNTCH